MSFWCSVFFLYRYGCVFSPEKFSYILLKIWSIPFTWYSSSSMPIIKTWLFSWCPTLLYVSFLCVLICLSCVNQLLCPCILFACLSSAWSLSSIPSSLLVELVTYLISPPFQPISACVFFNISISLWNSVLIVCSLLSGLSLSLPQAPWLCFLGHHSGI